MDTMTLVAPIANAIDADAQAGVPGEDFVSWALAYLSSPEFQDAADDDSDWCPGLATP